MGNIQFTYCRECNARFTSSIANKLFCSLECRTNNYRQKSGYYAKFPRYKKKCAICLIDFETGRRASKTCSLECSKQYDRKKQKEQQEKNKKYRVTMQNIIDGKVVANEKDLPHLKLRFAILNRDKFSCTYCGRSAKLDGAKLHIDHIVPVSQGGEWSMDNLTTSCQECNVGKSDVLLDK